MPPSPAPSTSFGRLLDKGRELEGLDTHSGELTRIVAAGGTIGPAAAYDAFELRTKVLLAAGRYDDALAIAETAIARMRDGKCPCARSRPAPSGFAPRPGSGKAMPRRPPPTPPRRCSAMKAPAPKTPRSRRSPYRFSRKFSRPSPTGRMRLPALLSRARELARAAARADTEGWEKALRRSYTLAISRLLAEGDPAAALTVARRAVAIRPASSPAALGSRTGQTSIDFPANVALLLYQRNFDAADIQLSLARTGLEAEYFVAHNYFASPLVRADLAEYSVLLALLKSDKDGAPLDGPALLALPRRSAADPE